MFFGQPPPIYGKDMYSQKLDDLNYGNRLRGT